MMIFRLQHSDTFMLHMASCLSKNSRQVSQLIRMELIVVDVAAMNPNRNSGLKGSGCNRGKTGGKAELHTS